MYLEGSLDVKKDTNPPTIKITNRMVFNKKQNVADHCIAATFKKDIQDIFGFNFYFVQSIVILRQIDGRNKTLIT